MKKVIRLTESDLHKIIRESVRRTLNEIGNTKKESFKRKLREGKPMPATKNTNWLADDESYFKYGEFPETHKGDVSYFDYDIPNNYKDYWDFDEDGMNGKTNYSLSSDSSAEDAWNEYDGKHMVMHNGNPRFDDLSYVKRRENPNYAIPNDEIYRRIGNPSQYDTYSSDAFPSDDFDDGIKPGVEL